MSDSRKTLSAQHRERIRDGVVKAYLNRGEKHWGQKPGFKISEEHKKKIGISVKKTYQRMYLAYLEKKKEEDEKKVISDSIRKQE